MPPRPPNARILPYDTGVYAFARVLEATVFKVPSLGRLHTYWQAQKRRRHGSSRLTYGDNLGLRRLMQDLPDHAPFIKLYHAFVHRAVAPLFGGRISYSNRPKMRVHLAGTPSVSGWHRDVDVTGRPDQINAFLPFTACFDGNTLWCESDYGSGDHQPIPLDYGELLLFDGGYLEHGTVPNRTDVTRVSLDFRFSPTRDDVEPPWSEILSGRPADVSSRRPSPAGPADTTTVPGRPI